MKRFTAILPALLAGIAASAGITLTDLASRLEAVGCYADTCRYEVLLPNLSEPVVYKVSLESAPAPGDTLAPCRYLISWELPSPSGLVEGFSAYFDGAHFRFRDARLQEYHAVDDSAPFAPGGDVARGVQQQVQFAELLPQFLGERFRTMAGDTVYRCTVTADTLVDGRHSTVVEGYQRANGYDGNEFTYIFDAGTLRPRRIELENNPGQIAEQSITVDYACADIAPECGIDMDLLLRDKAEAFEKYRTGTFSLASLAGMPLPEIVANTATGDRYVHHRGDALRAPTVIVFADLGVGSTPDVISDVRSALASLPAQVDILWAFSDNHADEVLAAVAPLQPGETALIHAAGAARNCGVGAVTPVLVFVRADGTVEDYIVGYNQELPSLVIDKASILL